MPTFTHPVDQLESIVAEFRHLRGEFRNESEIGSWRRTHGAQLGDLERRFETLLSRWVDEESRRAAWRRHLHEGASAPDDDLEPTPPIYLGSAENGSQIVVRPRDGRECDVFVDGKRVDSVSIRFNFGTHQSRLRLADREWEEESRAPSTALEALRRHTAHAHGEPPWEWARALFADGLIDVNFSLTDRGRRFMSR